MCVMSIDYGTYKAQCNGLKEFPSWLLKDLFSSKMRKHPSCPEEDREQMIHIQTFGES